MNRSLRSRRAANEAAACVRTHAPAELEGEAGQVSWLIDRPPMRAFFSLYGIPHGGRPTSNP